MYWKLTWPIHITSVWNTEQFSPWGHLLPLFPTLPLGTPTLASPLPMFLLPPASHSKGSLRSEFLIPPLLDELKYFQSSSKYGCKNVHAKCRCPSCCCDLLKEMGSRPPLGSVSPGGEGANTTDILLASPKSQEHVSSQQLNSSFSDTSGLRARRHTNKNKVH